MKKLAFLFLLSTCAIHAQTILDYSFGTKGTQVASISGGNGVDDQGRSVAIQGDGKIVVGGYSKNSTGYYQFAVARFNVDGTLDNTFGTNGTVRDSIAGGGRLDLGRSVAIQGDGKIVVAGSSQDAKGNSWFALARFNTDGSLDNTFGTNGTVRDSINGGNGADDEAYSTAIQGDGKIVVAGFSENSVSSNLYYAFAVARYDTNGTLDQSFGSNGTQRIFMAGGLDQDRGYSVVIQGDGKIVVGGSTIVSECAANYPHFAIARFNADGSVDNSFGINGTTRLLFNLTQCLGEVGNSLAIQQDGRIVIAGYGGPLNNQHPVITLARVNAIGRVDSTFGTNGKTITSISGGDGNDDEGQSLAIQHDGRILVAGFSQYVSGFYKFAVARFDTLGNLDTTFGAGGSFLTSINGQAGNDYGYAVAIQSDPKIVIAGKSLSGSGYYKFSVARIIPDTYHGLRNEITLLDVNCPSFSIQQNFFITTPGYTVTWLGGQMTWWVQNVIKISKDILGDITVQSCYNVYSYSGFVSNHVPKFNNCTLGTSFTFPNSFRLQSELRTNGVILSGYLGTTLLDSTFLPLDSMTSQSYVGIKDFKPPEFVLVGMDKDHSNAQFSPQTDGTSVVTWIEESGSWTGGSSISQRGVGGPSFNQTATGETSSGLSWPGLSDPWSGGNIASFSAVNGPGNYEGIQFAPSEIVTAVKQRYESIPQSISLDQNYPNPFNPNTTIQYQLRSESRVSLKIYNLLGQVIATLVNQTEQAGYKQVNWNASSFASGIYFYRLEATSVANPSKTYTQVKKMLLMK